MSEITTEIGQLKADAEREIAQLKAEAQAEIAKWKADAAVEIANSVLPSSPGAAPAAEADGAPAAPAEPTHNLLLSDGRTVEHTGAIPTLVHIGEDILSVVAAFEKRSQP